MADVDHGEIMLFLGRLDGKLDGVVDRLNTINGRLGKGEDRIRALESTENKHAGGIKVGTVIGSAVATAAYFILDKLIPGK